MTNKITTSIALILVICVTIVAVLGFSKKNSTFGGAAYNQNPSFYVASSTAFALTTTSLRLLATSTPTKRLGALVQSVNCTAGQPIFMRASNDAPATANTGMTAYSSTTFAFEDWPGIPVVQGSLQGITAAGTCTVLVTEWRSQY